MKTRNAYESHSRYSLWIKLLALTLCLLMGLSIVYMGLSKVEADVSNGVWGKGTLFNGTIDLDKEYKKEDLDDAMHIIIRHWHSKDNPDAGDEDTTVIVGAYIIPDEDNGYIVDTNGKKYTCYARAYTSANEATTKIHKKNYVRVTTATESNYISVAKSTLENTSGNSVFFMANPFSDSNGNNYERFAGFSVSAGQPAVTIHNGNKNVQYSDAKLEVDPAKVKKNHLVKSHLFYISEMSLVNGEEQTSSNQDFPDYIDTELTDSGKGYNTSEGLHTDKTASENTQYDDGRTYDLDLETWHNEGDPVNVGMVLDASGSMGFTANTPKPIRVTDASGNLTDDYADAVPSNVLTSLRTKKNSSTLSDAFLTDTELTYFMNPRNTDNSSIRSSSYTYFLYDARTGTEEFTPLAYWDGGRTFTQNLVSDSNKAQGKTNTTEYIYAFYENTQVVIGQITNPGGAGWYYNNPTGNWTTNYFKDDVQSGKNLIGIPSGYNFTDEIVLSSLRKPDLSGVDDNLNKNYTKGDNKSRTYSSSGENTPCKFYIDSQGYLRCLYWINKNNDPSTGDVRYGSSYVYENNDQDYIKVEALQRALGAFMTGLNSDSPESLMSAVRFSTPYASENRDYLVLMDWTSDILEAQQVLSNQRGKKVFDDGTIFYGTKLGTSSTGSDFSALVSGGITQYNYGLTGSTSTKQGLHSFMQYLKGRLDTYSTKTKTNGKKYLIIFTDGKDTDLETELGSTNVNVTTVENCKKTEAGQLAQQLKDEGYTIFCVMLTGGPIQMGSDDYNKAYNFLTALGGAGKGTNGVADNKYVYSTAEYMNTGDSGTGSDSVDALVKIFTDANGILDKMTEDLEGYTIQDYIDPRFDIVDASGAVWNLNAGGKVVVGEKTYDLSNGDSVTVTLYNDRFDTNLDNLLTVSEKDVDGNTKVGAETAGLYYDKVKDMYYLKWTSQTIPTTYVGASKAKVWHSKVTVRAKDDFIGGNAVLTNGNEAGENYVYHEGDKDANSGITDTVKSTENEYPSKGFPRTTVNVTPAEAKTAEDLEIYMGDDLYTSVIEQLIEKALEAGDTTTANFWEYIERYVDYYNEHPEYQDELKPKFSGLDDDEALSKLLDEDGKLSYEKLAQAIFEPESIFGVDSDVQLPYGYLPDTSGSNQTGHEEHEMDLMGYLSYHGAQTDGNGTYDKKDTHDRTFETELSFEPFDIDDERMSANSELVSDDDYTWDRSYKKEQGAPAESETIEGASKTEIVSGEIALQAYLASKDIETLRNAGVTKIIYTSDLMHKIQGSDDDAEPVKVATFTVEITIDSETGNVLQTARKIEYTDDYDFVRGSSDVDKSERIDHGLQFGIYTMTAGETTYMYSDGSVKDTGPIKFNAPVVVQDDDSYFYVENSNDNPFELNIKGKEDPWKYHGDLGNDGYIELGQLEEDATTGVSSPNLDSRFGIFRVTGTAAVGNLEITKTVEGTGDKDKEFEFIVKLTPPYSGLMNDGDSFPYEYTKADGTTETGELTVSESVENGITYYTGTVKLKLKHGDSVVIKNIPAEVTYTITEDEESSEGYSAESKGNNEKIEDSKTKTVSFINSPIALSVTKQVMIDPLRKLNNMPNLDNIYFTFVMTLSGDEYENTTIDAIVLTYDSDNNSWTYPETDYETMPLEFIDNTATFELRDGEGIMISGLPVGTKYTVKEIIAEDGDFYFNHVDLGSSRYDDVAEDFDDTTDKLTYTVTGEISRTENSAVHYFNSTLNFRLPLTGGNTVVMIYVMIAGMLLILSGAIILIFFKKRRTQY